VIYLDEEDLLHIAERVLTPQQPVVRDMGLLSMSAHRPQSFAFGVEPYPTVSDKAAALLVAICMNHPLVDGNKRLAFAACWVFCDINAGRQPALSQDEGFELVMSVARGDFDVPEVAAILKGAGLE
jgi:death on curing protein